MTVWVALNIYCHDKVWYGIAHFQNGQTSSNVCTEISPPTGYDFGCRQSGETVHNVILPPWAKDDARLFVQIMKQALESTYVTQKLHSWVDLVFGYKQLGQHAVDAINVFHPAVSSWCESLTASCTML